MKGAAYMGFTRRRPEEVGIAPRDILKMMDDCDKEVDHLHGFIVMKDGTVVADCAYAPCSNAIPHNGLSLGKSMTAIAIGMLIDEGKLSFDTKVVPMFKDQLPPQYDARLDQLTIENLLNMQASSAIVSTPFLDQPKGSWITHYFSYTPHTDPGKVFHYDTGGYYLLSCVVTKVACENVYSYLKRRLFDPLGIEHGYFLEDGVGNNVGGWGFFFNLEDEAKIAYCLTNGGIWEGQQLVPEWFVDSLKTARVSTKEFPHLGWTYGYSNGFWKGRESIFLAFGAFGQLLICDPVRHITVATSAGCSHDDCKKLMEIIQNDLILTTNTDRLPNDDETFGMLEERIKNAQLPLPKGSQSVESSMFGTFVPAAEYDIKEICLEDAGEKKLRLSLKDTLGMHTLTAACCAWITDENGVGSAYAYDGHALNIYRQVPSLTSEERIRLVFEGGEIIFSQSSSPSLTATSDSPQKFLRKKRG